MNLIIRTAISTPKRLFRCTIPIQQLSTNAENTLISQQQEQPLTCSHTLNKPKPLTSPSTWPRPTQIPHQQSFLNLFGIVQIPIQFHATPDGQNIAATIIAPKDGSVIANSSDSVMVPVVFEGDLAHSVASHVKPYDCVYVSGKLSLNPLPFVLSENQGECYLVGNQIKFVHGLSYPIQNNDDNSNAVKEQVRGTNTNFNVEKKSARYVELGGLNFWRDLVKNPMDWCDCREKKSIGSVKANHPDFKHKTNGTSLWLNNAPNWVLARLNVRKRNKEDSWKDLVENPHKWWDNRPRKTNVNRPDFMHKETCEPLWLDSSPKWVLGGPEGLDVLKGKKDYSWKDLVENPDKWCDNRPRKTNANEPDFIHKETCERLWLNSSPKWVLAGPKGLDVLKGKKDDSWKDLIENPDKWWDNRPTKTNLKAPDFVHKETNEGLWLQGSPKWVSSGPGNAGKWKKEDDWKDFVENPNEWLDNRPRKTSVNAPDFVHKETSQGLWLDTRPKWAVSQFPC